MILRKINEGQITIFDLPERIDSYIELEEEFLFSHFNETGLPPNIILNFEYVRFIDSSGLGRLVKIWKQCKSENGHLVFCNVTEKALEIIEITRLTNVFELYPNEASAISSFKISKTHAAP